MLAGVGTHARPSVDDDDEGRRFGLIDLGLIISASRRTVSAAEGPASQHSEQARNRQSSFDVGNV